MAGGVGARKNDWSKPFFIRVFSFCEMTGRKNILKTTEVKQAHALLKIAIDTNLEILKPYCKDIRDLQKMTVRTSGTHSSLHKGQRIATCSSPGISKGKPDAGYNFVRTACDDSNFMILLLDQVLYITQHAEREVGILLKIPFTHILCEEHIARYIDYMFHWNDADQLNINLIKDVKSLNDDIETVKSRVKSDFYTRFNKKLIDQAVVHLAQVAQVAQVAHNERVQAEPLAQPAAAEALVETLIQRAVVAEALVNNRTDERDQARDERDQALARAVAAEQENVGLQAQVAVAHNERDQALAHVAVAHNERDQALAQVAVAHNERDQALAQVAVAHNERDQALAQVAQVVPALQADVAIPQLSRQLRAVNFGIPVNVAIPRTISQIADLLRGRAA